ARFERRHGGAAGRREEQRGRTDGQDQTDANGGGEASLLPGRRVGLSQPARRTVHREHREIPPARGSLTDPDRRGTGLVLAVGGGSAHRAGPELAEGEGDL